MTPNSNMKNGVNIDDLQHTMTVVKSDPDLAQFEFRVKNNWIDGGHCISCIKSFYGVGSEDNRPEEGFIMESDHPNVLMGNDKAATPPEIVLHALGSCLTAAMTYHAAANGIDIDGAESTIEGGVDLHGFLGLDPEVRKGFNYIKVRLKVKSDASIAQLEELAKHSPVFDIITNPTPVKVEFIK